MEVECNTETRVAIQEIEIVPQRWNSHMNFPDDFTMVNQTEENDITDSLLHLDIHTMLGEILNKDVISPENETHIYPDIPVEEDIIVPIRMSNPYLDNWFAKNFYTNGFVKHTNKHTEKNDINNSNSIEPKNQRGVTKNQTDIFLTENDTHANLDVKNKMLMPGYATENGSNETLSTPSDIDDVSSEDDDVDDPGEFLVHNNGNNIEFIPIKPFKDYRQSVIDEVDEDGYQNNAGDVIESNATENVNERFIDDNTTSSVKQGSSTTSQECIDILVSNESEEVIFNEKVVFDNVNINKNVASPFIKNECGETINNAVCKKEKQDSDSIDTTVKDTNENNRLKSAEVDIHLNERSQYFGENHRSFPDVSYKKTDSVNVYSENIIQESDSTENVDRDSIADLNLTRTQWENLHEKVSTHPQNSTPNRKNVVRHWSVRIPKFEKIPPSHCEIITTSQEMNSTESVIAREIRIAKEREENIRIEHLNAVDEISQKQSHTGCSPIPKTSLNHHSINGHATDMVDFVGQRDHMTEVDQQIAKNQSNQNRHASRSEVDHTMSSFDSVLQNEITNQRDMDMDSYKERIIGVIARDDRNNNRQVKAPRKTSPQELKNVKAPTDKGVNKYVVQPIYVKSSSSETALQRELRELKEREEELQKERNHNISQDVEKINLTADSVNIGDSSNDKITVYNNETPIERDIRLAEERQKEYIHDKGVHNVASKQSVTPKPNVVKSSTSDSYVGTASTRSKSAKRQASSRIQNEIIEVKQREEALRNDGKILTTSEDRIEPPALSNFNNIAMTNEQTNINLQFPRRPSQVEILSGGNVKTSKPKITHTFVHAKPAPMKRISGETPSFSYKETHQNAETLIEKELKEMKEREKELQDIRQMTPQHDTSQNSQIPKNHSNIVAQWEKRSKPT